MALCEVIGWAHGRFGREKFRSPLFPHLIDSFLAHLIAHLHTLLPSAKYKHMGLRSQGLGFFDCLVLSLSHQNDLYKQVISVITWDTILRFVRLFCCLVLLNKWGNMDINFHFYMLHTLHSCFNSLSLIFYSINDLSFSVCIEYMFVLVWLHLETRRL